MEPKCFTKLLVLGVVALFSPATVSASTGSAEFHGCQAKPKDNVLSASHMLALNQVTTAAYVFQNCDVSLSSGADPIWVHEAFSVYIALGMLSEAESLVGRLANSDKESIIQLCSAYYGSGDDHASGRCIEQHFGETLSGNFEALYLGGLVAFRQKQYGDAERYSRGAVEMYPHDDGAVALWLASLMSLPTEASLACARSKIASYKAEGFDPQGSLSFFQAELERLGARRVDLSEAVAASGGQDCLLPD